MYEWNVSDLLEGPNRSLRSTPPGGDASSGEPSKCCAIIKLQADIICHYVTNDETADDRKTRMSYRCLRCLCAHHFARLSILVATMLHDSSSSLQENVSTCSCCQRGLHPALHPAFHRHRQQRAAAWSKESAVSVATVISAATGFERVVFIRFHIFWIRHRKLQYTELPAAILHNLMRFCEARGVLPWMKALPLFAYLQFKRCLCRDLSLQKKTTVSMSNGYTVVCIRQWFRDFLEKFLLVLRIQQDSRSTPHYEEPFALEISKVTMPWWPWVCLIW